MSPLGAIERRYGSTAPVNWPSVQVVMPGRAVSCQVVPPSKLTPTKLACKSCPTQVATRCLGLVGSTTTRVSISSLKFILPGGLKPVSQLASGSGSFETWMSGPILKSLAHACTANCATTVRHDSLPVSKQPSLNFFSALRRVTDWARPFASSSNLSFITFLSRSAVLSSTDEPGSKRRFFQESGKNSELKGRW